MKLKELILKIFYYKGFFMMLSRFLQSVATVPVVFCLNRKIKMYGSPRL